MKRNYYSSIHEKLDRILELLEDKAEDQDTYKFDHMSKEPILYMEELEPEERNDQERNKYRLETHYWNSPNTIE